MGHPNVVFVFGDQWRAQATGYAGDPNARTPHLDRLAGESVNLATAVSCCPVCSPYRASLMTGRYAHAHGVFVNDAHLSDEAVSIAQAFGHAGYDTAYIGKWHLEGHGRSAFIPRERRQGFDFWRALECTHAYHQSRYFGDENRQRTWDGYDAFAQTREAARYIADHPKDKPFLLMLSWGPPHDPYGAAPAEFRRLYDPARIQLRPNVPAAMAERARENLAGYYAHCSALDACVGEVARALDDAGIAENTLLVFTSDHGDMLESHAEKGKQQPYDESIRVPFLLRWPAALGRQPRTIETPFGAPDIMPTLLGLCGIEIPQTVQGEDSSATVKGEASAEPADDDGAAALIACYSPFANWRRERGGREYRGVRTRRHTYVRALDGPWLLFDNERDPYQLDNLCGSAEHAGVHRRLDALLSARLAALGDDFAPGPPLLARWGYEVGANGAIPYTN